MPNPPSKSPLSSGTKPLAGLTLLIASSNSSNLQLAAELERQGARVITWPEIDIGEPESSNALDEAIENLFGYDWLLFLNANAFDFFLRRFQELGHEISELDSLRVCAIGGATITRLEESQVHLDLTPDSPSAEAVFAAIESYAGGREALGRLNLLVPRASLARDDLCEMLEGAGARVDAVTTYRTVAANNPALTQLNALLAGGGIDCVVLTEPETVQNLAQLWDTNDLSRILAGVAVACADETVERAAVSFGLRTEIMPAEFTVAVLARAIADFFNSAARESVRNPDASG